MWWTTARQRGVTRARNEAHDSSMLVLNGAEVNRVLDYAQNGLRRVINAVVPQVNADMLTYSSYDAMVYGSDAQSVKQSLTQALQTIEKLAPDPQRLGNRRILISEYGLFENEQPGDTRRADAVLSTAKRALAWAGFSSAASLPRGPDSLPPSRRPSTGTDPHDRVAEML